MLEGRFIFEIAPNQILLAEGPWTASSEGVEWEFAILPFKPLRGDSPNFLNAKHVRIVKREDLSHCDTLQKSPLLEWEMSPRIDFTTSFQALQRLIQTGKAQKGVPWASASATWEKAQSHWEKLLKNAPHLASHLVVYGAELTLESVLGATPEWLFQIEAGGRTLNTMALAGTRWIGQERTSLQEKKDAQEHELVVEDIRTRLQVFGEVQIGERHWHQAGSVEHLRTPIKLIAKQTLDAVEVLAVMHPTPAVGVSPRSPEAEAWLYQLPGHATRADFAAPWVVRNRLDGRAWALVALRQLRLRDDHVFIPAGCGVIADSVEEVEWCEIQEKINSVKKAWGLA